MSKLDPWTTQAPGALDAGRAFTTSADGMVLAMLQGFVYYFEPEDALGFAEALAEQARAELARREHES